MNEVYTKARVKLSPKNYKGKLTEKAQNITDRKEQNKNY